MFVSFITIQTSSLLYNLETDMDVHSLHFQIYFLKRELYVSNQQT